MKRYTSFLGKVSVICGAFLPALAFAAGNITTFEGLVNKFIDILSMVIPLIFSIALVAFLWGIFQYFFSGAEKKDEARDFLLYGLIGLFIMVSVWGLVRILTGTFDLKTTQPNLPGLGAGSSSSGSGSGGYYQGYTGGANYPARPTSGAGSGASPFDSNAPISGSGSIGGSGDGSADGSGSGSRDNPGTAELDKAAGDFPR